MASSTVNAYQLRLKHLNGAAKLLAFAAPTVSASINAEEAALLSEQCLPEQGKSRLLASQQLENRRKDICNACGCIMIPGWSCNVRIETINDKRARSQRMKKSLLSVKFAKQSRRSCRANLEGKQLNRKRIIYTCSRCVRKTFITLADETPPRLQNTATKNTQYVTHGHMDRQRQISNVHSSNMKTIHADATGNSSATTITSLPGTARESPADKSGHKRGKERKQGTLQAILAKRKADSSSKVSLNLMDFMKST